MKVYSIYNHFVANNVALIFKGQRNANRPNYNDVLQLRSPGTVIHSISQGEIFVQTPESYIYEVDTHQFISKNFCTKRWKIK